jgi:hypothetical protein
VETQIKEPKRKTAALHEEDPVSRSIGIGIACTLLFHLLLLWLSPQFSLNKFSGVHSGIAVKTNKGKSFDFQLDPVVPEPPKQNPFRYVDTNPDAPENTPDKTPNFSNRNQQSAQPDPAKEKDPENRPSITNAQDQIKNDASIVTGNLAKPQQGAAAAPEVIKNDSKQTQAEMKARAAQTPLSGFEKTEGLSEDGIAMNVSKAKAQNNHADQEVEGAPDAKDTTGGLIAVNQVNKAQPKARPRLTAPRSTILTNRVTGVQNVGVLGMDARWSEYGEYLNQMLEIIQTQWYRILEESRVSPPRGSHVVVTFKINSKGETEIVKVEDSDSGKQGVLSCENAVTDPQPYRKWTEQMISVLGDDQTITLAFYYQ